MLYKKIMGAGVLVLLLGVVSPVDAAKTDGFAFIVNDGKTQTNPTNSFRTTSRKVKSNTPETQPFIGKSIRSARASCNAVLQSVTQARRAGARNIPVSIERAGSFRYVLISSRNQVNGVKKPKVYIKRVSPTTLYIQARKGSPWNSASSPGRAISPYTNSGISSARCSDAICPVVMVDTRGYPRVSCKNPKLKSINDIFGNRDNRLNSGAYDTPPTFGRAAPSQQRRTQAKQSGGASPTNGFIKQLQNLFKQKQQQKAQEEARKRREEQRKRQEYLARLRLPQCNPAHPYYSYNKARCASLGNTTNPIIESYGSVPRTQRSNNAKIDTIIVRKGTGAQDATRIPNNPLAITKGNERKCINKEAKSLIVARPKEVESGKEATIRWASVCTASCQVTATEVGVENARPILTELGTKGEITGRVYNDTRFDLQCKNYADKPIKKSSITVRVK